MTRIIQALNECLDALPRQQLRRVRGIGVSGQMHGILFWKAGQGMLGVGNDLMLWSLDKNRASKGFWTRVRLSWHGHSALLLRTAYHRLSPAFCVHFVWVKCVMKTHTVCLCILVCYLWTAEEKVSLNFPQDLVERISY